MPKYRCTAICFFDNRLWDPGEGFETQEEPEYLPRHFVLVAESDAGPDIEHDAKPDTKPDPAAEIPAARQPATKRKAASAKASKPAASNAKGGKR